SVEVPDWSISTQELIVYPLLKNIPALTFDGTTHEITWNMDKDSPRYITSLAKVLVELHNIPENAVKEKDLKIKNSTDLRKEIKNQLILVKSEIGISKELETRYNTWLDKDSLWPDFTRFIHGDLYAGHILTTKDNE